ncbi:MAG: EAL domain-containing protein, partial [Magnetococcales bacterium]|nr:EAL domain-containing protein [Magnetococcales bacterium]MBF0115219.1 EAL domain-containing protein [Magnetococcales bacterium]
MGNLNMSNRLNEATHYGDLRFSSRFQPIFSLAHRRVIGHEGLLRIQQGNGTPLSPLHLFHGNLDPLELLTIDRLTRGMHIRQFVHQARYSTGWLFLNFNPQVIMIGDPRQFNYTKELLRIHNFSPDRVVVEILENSIHDERLIRETVEYYRGLGCLIAIDDFGAGQSNFDRVWNLNADIVKLDRSLIVNAAANPRAQPFLTSITSMLHEAGKLVLLEGIETEEHALIALNADVDFVQGFHFGRPEPTVIDPTLLNTQIESLSTVLRSQDAFNARQQVAAMEQHTQRFQEVLDNFACAGSAKIGQTAFENKLLSVSSWRSP